MLPEKGTYFAELQSAVLGDKRMKADGTWSAPQMVFSFQITHISKNGAWQALPGPFMRHVYSSLSEAAWPSTEQKLQALGFNGDFQNPDFSDKTKNEGVELTCTHQEYQGKTSDKWEFSNWGTTEVKRASVDIVRQMNAKWKAKVGAKPAAKAPQADGPRDEDAPGVDVNEPGAQG
jgi:hypothetical protein